MQPHRPAPLALAAVFALVSCVSEEGADRRWQRFVDKHNECSTADDCAVVYPGCPLGCATAVAKEHEQKAVERAEKIVKAYERGGRSCAYNCLGPGELMCSAGTCELGEPPQDP